MQFTARENYFGAMLLTKVPTSALISSAAISGSMFIRYRERRERCPVANLKLLKDVMKMHLDRTVRNMQATADLLIG